MTDTFFTQLFCTIVECNFHECVCIHTHIVCIYVVVPFSLSLHYFSRVVRWVFAKWTIFQETSPQFSPYLQSFEKSEIFTYNFSSSSSWGFLKHKHTILLFLLMKHLQNNTKIKRKSQECKGILK